MLEGEGKRLRLILGTAYGERAPVPDGVRDVLSRRDARAGSAPAAAG